MNEEFAWLSLVQPCCYRPRPLQLGSHIAIVGASTLSFLRVASEPPGVIRRSPCIKPVPYRGAWVIGVCPQHRRINPLTLKLRELRVHRDTSARKITTGDARTSSVGSSRLARSKVHLPISKFRRGAQFDAK